MESVIGLLPPPGIHEVSAVGAIRARRSKVRDQPVRQACSQLDSPHTYVIDWYVVCRSWYLLNCNSTRSEQDWLEVGMHRSPQALLWAEEQFWWESDTTTPAATLKPSSVFVMIDPRQEVKQSIMSYWRQAKIHLHQVAAFFREWRGINPHRWQVAAMNR
jgi:hypothetical protein